MHLSVYLSIYLSIYLSTYLPIYLSIYLSSHLCICLTISLSINLPIISVYLSVYLSAHLSACIVCLSMCLSFYLPISLFDCQPVFFIYFSTYLLICLSIFCVGEEAIMRNFCQKERLTCPKQSTSARRPHKMKVHSSQLQNDEILRDFL